MYQPKKKPMFLAEFVKRGDDDANIMKVMFVRGATPGEAFEKARERLDGEYGPGALYYITDVRMANEKAVTDFKEFEVYTDPLGWDEDDLNEWLWL